MADRFLLNNRLVRLWFVFFGGICCAGSFAGAAEQPKQPDPPKKEVRTTELTYDLDATLLFSDTLKGLSRSSVIGGRDPKTPLADPAPSSTNNIDGGYRTLGIRHVKLGLEWTTPRRFKAFVLIRPDATGSQGTIRREVDTRAGTTTTPANDINFLDLYELTIMRPGVNASVGVREKLVPEWKAYADILEFGLEPRDPRKSFGAFLDLPSLTTVGTDGFLSAKIAVVGSSNERHNGRSTNPDTGDTAPSRSSPYWGGVVSSSFRPFAGLDLGIGAAMNEEPVGDGKVTRNFYDAGIVRRLEWGAQSVKLGMDFRQFRDSYKVKSIQYADLQGTSCSVTSAIDFTTKDALLAAIRVGTGTHQQASDTSKSLPGRGLQGELGFRSWLDDGIEATMLVTREWRKDQDDSGAQVGGFGTEPNRRAILSRFALQVAYRTGGTP